MGYGPADSMADAAISGVRRHYDSIWQETADGAPVAAKVFQLCWISSLWNAGAGSRKKLYPLPTPFLGIFVYFVLLPRKICYHPHAEAARSLGSVYRPRNASLEPPRLVVLKLPYRFVVTPNYEYVLELERNNQRSTWQCWCPKWSNVTGFTTCCTARVPRPSSCFYIARATTGRA